MFVWLGYYAEKRAGVVKVLTKGTDDLSTMSAHAVPKTMILFQSKWVLDVLQVPKSVAYTEPVQERYKPEFPSKITFGA